MAYKVAIIFLLYAWCPNGNAQEKTGKIVFYRESHFIDYDYKPLLYCDGFELARIVNGSYAEVAAQPGRHECVAEFAEGPMTMIDIVPGGVAYQRVVITPTLKRHAVLTASSEEEFRQQKKLTRIATAELDSVQPLAPVALPSPAPLAKADNHESAVNVSEPEAIFQPGVAGVSYPRCVFCPDPKYTAKARHDKIEGTVTLKVVIGTDGTASNIELVKGLGQGMDEQAINAVKNWRFEPARGPNGEPVAVVAPIEITFRILK
jgi:TonB family protein